jgi:hypothetical protein
MIEAIRMTPRYKRARRTMLKVDARSLIRASLQNLEDAKRVNRKITSLTPFHQLSHGAADPMPS